MTAAIDPRDEAPVHLPERLLRILNVGSIGIWRWDVGAGSIDLSAKAAALIGHPTAGVIAYPDFLQYIHPEDRDAVVRSMQDSGVTFGAFDFEVRTCARRWIC